MSELHNAHVALDCFWHFAARRIRDRALEARTPAVKAKAVEEELLAQLRPHSEMHPAVAYALREFSRAPHLRSVASVTDEIGLSPRRFIDVFTQQTGYTPKLFCRVRRFQQAITLSRAGCHVDWLGVALSCGYYDQAHFVHDFRAFSGLNPTAYLHLRSEHQNHVPLGKIFSKTLRRPSFKMKP